jgi:hypothetical protein
MPRRAAAVAVGDNGEIATGRQRTGWDEKGAEVRLAPEILDETPRPDIPQDGLGYAIKFRHNDTQHLAELLAEHRAGRANPQATGAWIRNRAGRIGRRDRNARAVWGWLFVRRVSAYFFMPCVELHQERKHFAWQFLWNFIAAVQRLTYRSEHGGSRRLVRVRQAIALVAGSKAICHGRNLSFAPLIRAKRRNRQWFLSIRGKR